jgi:flagellar protein FlbD
MIRLTRISNTPVVLNSDLIEHIESTPDTVISLTTGQKFVVRENAEEVVRRVVAFRRSVAWRPMPDLIADLKADYDAETGAEPPALGRTGATREVALGVRS